MTQDRQLDRWHKTEDRRKIEETQKGISSSVKNQNRTDGQCLCGYTPGRLERSLHRSCCKKPNNRGCTHRTSVSEYPRREATTSERSPAGCSKGDQGQDCDTSHGHQRYRQRWIDSERWKVVSKRIVEAARRARGLAGVTLVYVCSIIPPAPRVLSIVSKTGVWMGDINL